LARAIVPQALLLRARAGESANVELMTKGRQSSAQVVSHLTVQNRRQAESIAKQQRLIRELEAANRQLAERTAELEAASSSQTAGKAPPEVGPAGQANQTGPAPKEPTFFVITASADATAQMWSTRTGELLRTFRGHTDALWSCCLSPDCMRLFTTSQDGTAKMWDVSTGRCIRTYAGQQGAPNWACVTLDMQYLITAVNDETAKVWQVDSGMFVKSLPHKGCVCSVVTAPDGRHIFSADGGGFGRKFTVPNFEEVCIFDGQNKQGLYSCFLSGDGRRFFTASHDGSVKMFDADLGGGVLLSFEGPGKASSVVTSPTAPLVFCGRGDGGDGVVQMFSTETGELLGTFRGHGRGVSAMWVTPDGRRLLTASWDKTARVWDIATTSSVLTYRTHTSLVQGIVCG